MDPGNFREKDGILVHIDDRGKPVFGGNGFHRLSISKALQLEKIPACVGMVDKGAMDHLKKYRQKPNSFKDRKSTRLNSSHVAISYAVFCLKKKKRQCQRNQSHHETEPEENKEQRKTSGLEGTRWERTHGTLRRASADRTLWRSDTCRR